MPAFILFVKIKIVNFKTLKIQPKPPNQTSALNISINIFGTISAGDNGTDVSILFQDELFHTEATYFVSREDEEVRSGQDPELVNFCYLLHLSVYYPRSRPTSRVSPAFRSPL